MEKEKLDQQMVFEAQALEKDLKIKSKIFTNLHIIIKGFSEVSLQLQAKVRE